MDLNLPIWHLVEQSENILIAGAGGGFDIYAGLPLYLHLRERGKNVHLANYSFTPIEMPKAASKAVVEIPSLLVGTQGRLRRQPSYFPEGYLAEWLSINGYGDEIVWMFSKGGVQPLSIAYKHLVEKLKIDALILCDGGVDSIMRGDEQAPGTVIEDSITLAAVSKLDVPVMIQACLGFGTEVEEHLSHDSALENMAALIQKGGFHGSCALTKEMDVFQKYESACRHAWEGDENRHKSHIHTRVIPAIQGEFGNHHMYNNDKAIPLYISPLMNLYWFFDARQVIERNIIIDMIQDSLLVEDALQSYMQWAYKNDELRPRRNIPY